MASYAIVDRKLNLTHLVSLPASKDRYHSKKKISPLVVPIDVIKHQRDGISYIREIKIKKTLFLFQDTDVVFTVITDEKYILTKK